MKQFLSFLSISFLFLLTACGGGGDDTTGGDVVSTAAIIVSSQSVTLSPNGESTEIKVEGRNCIWQIADNSGSSWLTASKKGEFALSLSAGANNTGASRTAYVRINGGNAKEKVITVTQQAQEEKLQVSASSLNFVAGGESHSVTVTADGSWILSNDASSWCQASVSSGSGNMEITFTAKLNETGKQRQGTATLKGRTAEIPIVLTQEAGDAPTVSDFQNVSVGSTEASFSFRISSVVPATSFGLCYSETNQQPTTSDGHTTHTDHFTQRDVTDKIENLQLSRTYYVRAYATNPVGTNYSSNVLTITTTNDIPGSDDNIPPTPAKQYE